LVVKSRAAQAVSGVAAGDSRSELALDTAEQRDSRVDRAGRVGLVVDIEVLLHLQEQANFQSGDDSAATTRFRIELSLRRLFAVSGRSSELRTA
jgi:hypothetical protein